MIEIFTANKSGSNIYHQPTINVNLYHQLIGNGTSDQYSSISIRIIQIIECNLSHQTINKGNLLNQPSIKDNIATNCSITRVIFSTSRSIRVIFTTNRSIKVILTTSWSKKVLYHQPINKGNLSANQSMRGIFITN